MIWNLAKLRRWSTGCMGESAERAGPGFGANSQGGCQRQGPRPLTLSGVACKCIHAPSQGWDCPPPTSVPGPDPRTKSWSIDQHQELGRTGPRSKGRRGSRDQDQGICSELAWCRETSLERQGNQDITPVQILADLFAVVSLRF